MKYNNIIEKFENFGLLNEYLKPNARIIIGLSGGPDSLALTLLFTEIQKKYSLYIICAHINYHLRGEDSILDEKFVKDFCYQHNIPLYVLDTSIKKEESVQKKAREIRLEYFRKLKKHYKMDYIALGHQMHDQSETVLHRLIRGAGFTGLSGINPVKEDIIHPVLLFSKEVLLEFLKQNNIQYRLDKSNLTNEYTRNKIRNDLLPHIKQEYNPSFEQRLIDYGTLFYLSENYFKHQAKKDFKKALIVKNQSDIILDINYLKNCFPIIKFYICREAWSILTLTDKDFYSVHFHDIMSIVDSKTGYKEIFLPEDVLVMKDYQYLIFRKKDKYQSPIKEKNKEISVIRNVFSFNDRRFTMQKLKQLPEEGLGLGFDQIIIDFDKIVFPITLRYRQDGDKFIPFGMKGFKKLKDFFIDEKIPKIERDYIVVFTDAEKIFWISGYRLDQRVAVSEETKNFLQVKLENLSEFKNRSAERKIRNRG